MELRPRIKKLQAIATATSASNCSGGCPASPSRPTASSRRTHTAMCRHPPPDTPMTESAADRVRACRPEPGGRHTLRFGFHLRTLKRMMRALPRLSVPAVSQSVSQSVSHYVLHMWSAGMTSIRCRLLESMSSTSASVVSQMDAKADLHCGYWTPERKAITSTGV